MHVKGTAWNGRSLATEVHGVNAVTKLGAGPFDWRAPPASPARRARLTVVARLRLPEGSIPQGSRPASSPRFAGRSSRRYAHEHDHSQGWHDDLLQGLGHGSGRDPLARMAVE